MYLPTYDQVPFSAMPLNPRQNCLYNWNNSWTHLSKWSTRWYWLTSSWKRGKRLRSMRIHLMAFYVTVMTWRHLGLTKARLEWGFCIIWFAVDSTIRFKGVPMVPEMFLGLDSSGWQDIAKGHLVFSNVVGNIPRSSIEEVTREDEPSKYGMKPMWAPK